VIVVDSTFEDLGVSLVDVLIHELNESMNELCNGVSSQSSGRRAFHG